MSIILHCLSLLALALLTINEVTAKEKKCTKYLEQYRIANTGVGAHAIRASGHYCLKENIFVRWNYGWLGAGVQYSSDSVVTIFASDVTLNLEGYTISGKGGLHAAVDTIYDPNGLPVQDLPMNITIRNGMIRVEKDGAGVAILGMGGNPGIDIAADLSDAWKIRDGRSFDKSDRFNDDLAISSFLTDENLPQPNKPADYTSRHITIEHLNIVVKKDRPAISIQGAGTIIKNNIIEVNGSHALWLGGPNALVENNIFIVNGITPPVTADAIIRLKHGDGAIIRNNTFVLKGKANKRLISTFVTSSLIFENNNVYGMRKNEPIARSFSGSLQIREKNNQYLSTAYGKCSDTFFRCLSKWLSR